MINKKYILTLITAVFILIGCGSSTNSYTDTATDSQTQDDQVNSNDDNQDDQTIDDSQDEPIREVAVDTKPSNWYIRITAEDSSRSMKTGSTQLGELEVSNAVEKHTLKALTPFGGTYLDIIFRDPAGVDAGDYKVNYHTYDAGTEDRWVFTVRTDDVNADILLSWRGLFVLTPYTDDQNRLRYKEYRSTTNPLIKNMKLIDVDTGNEIAATVNGKVQIYSFNMDGQSERTFEWVVQIDEVDIPAQVNKLSTLQIKAIQKDTTASKISTISQKAETFDLSKPPMIKDEGFGK